jgi:hypothetical protein
MKHPGTKSPKNLLAISVADMTRPTGIDWCRDNKSLKDFPIDVFRSLL